MSVLRAGRLGEYKAAPDHQAIIPRLVEDGMDNEKISYGHMDKRAIARPFVI